MMLLDAMMDNMACDKDGFNPVYMMAISGARGNKQQIRQLAGMRGLIAIHLVVSSTYQSKQTLKKAWLYWLLYILTVLVKVWPIQLFVTADSGYLTRRLVDVSQDVNRSWGRLWRCRYWSRSWTCSFGYISTSSFRIVEGQTHWSRFWIRCCECRNRGTSVPLKLSWMNNAWRILLNLVLHLLHCAVHI